MFRLDYIEGEAVDCAEVTHMQTARRLAVQASKAAGLDVVIVRTGSIERPVLTVKPDGTFWAPPGVESACTRGSGRACFCPACRAERKAATIA